MNYTKVLEKYNLTEAEVSPGIRRKIAEIIQLQKDIEKVTQMLSTGNLSAKKQERMESDLENAKEALPVMDENLCKAIETWYPKREQYAAKGQQLKAARDAKKNGGEVSKPAKEPQRATAAVSNPPAGAAAPAVAAPNKPADPVKKTRSPWGWIGFAALVLVATVVGVNIHNSNGK